LPVAAQIELEPIDLASLRQIAAGETVVLDSMTTFAGALPPGHVAALSLAEVDAGTPLFWCVPFLIVSRARGAVVGSCRFKTVPIEGSVEISYGIARSQRGQGIATAAIGQLLQLAATRGGVQQVVAHILPDNQPSARLVSRLGFSRERTFTDLHGDEVVRWVWSVRAAAQPVDPL
jgi:[ribosomal protein S5]-alanine N-acetyltransferase